MAKVEFTFALLREQDLGHHSLVLVIQQMTMEYGHAFDDWVCKIQDDINGAAIRNIHGIKPRRMRERGTVLCVSQEVDLVYVERMEFSSLVDNSPMLISTYANARHRTCIRRELAAIDVEAVFVFCEGDSEVRCGLLEWLNVEQLVEGRAVANGAHSLRRCT